MTKYQRVYQSTTTVNRRVNKDGLFKLKRPVKPEWMSQELYDKMPEDLVIRAVRNKRRIVVTTLLDAEEYPRTEIIALHLKRWHVATDFDVIKTTIKMDMLRCKSPEMVRKEISVNLLEIIGLHVVGNRPGRSDPRAVKKRPKPHKRLQHPRGQARRLKQYQGKAA